MFQTVNGQDCLGLTEKAFALSLSSRRAHLPLPQPHFTGGARSSGEDSDSLKISTVGPEPIIPHGNVKDWGAVVLLQGPN